jgi:hypothetical protein
VTTPAPIGRALKALRSQEGGYVAVMTGLLMIVFMGLAAFAVDVGHWYVVGQQEQRAADAAALAGVTSLPANSIQAFASAQSFSKVNGFQNGGATTVTPIIDGGPTRLRVTVTTVVDNIFGPLLGVPKTSISRTAVADYAGPVPLGSPCNEYGNDPDAAGHQSANCSGVAQLWANVGSLGAPKVSGDAFQNGVCAAANDGCSGSSSGPNTDYDPNGYFYSVTVTATVPSLKIEAFDPALIDVGDVCDKNNLVQAKTLAYPLHTAYADAATRYGDGTTGAAGAYCTGDVRYGGTGDVRTQFTVWSPPPNPWNPMSGSPISGCTQAFDGFSGDLNVALDKKNAGYNSSVAANFRQWKTLCSLTNAAPGTYMIQVKTNGLLSDQASGHNRFSLRAYSSIPAQNDSISVAGFNKMAMYANTPNGTTRFYLAKVPSGAKGQLFNVSLFDVGDGAVAGSTITVLPPTEMGVGATFSGCTGSGVVTGNLVGFCGISVNSSFNGKWQTISVPISSTYACNDLSATGCWVRLQFYYGPGSSPMDTTSWTASIEGDPVRLVE